MSEEHKDHPATVEDAPRHLGDPNILNSTKVVRLFLLDPAAGRTEATIRANESPARADVFVDRSELTRDGSKSRGDLIPKSIGLSALVGHEQAHHEHHGSIVVLKGKEGDQIEWQCDVPFRVEAITRPQMGTSTFLRSGNPQIIRS